MKKSAKNSIINGLMLICMSAIAGTGFLIKYTLISGQKRWEVYGENVKLNILGMDRHQWGEIHLIIGYIFLGLLTLHLFLHWKTIICVCTKIFKKNWVYKISTVALISFSFLFMLIPFFISPKVIKTKQSEDRQFKPKIQFKKNNTHRQKELFNKKS